MGEGKEPAASDLDGQVSGAMCGRVTLEYFRGICLWDLLWCFVEKLQLMIFWSEPLVSPELAWCVTVVCLCQTGILTQASPLSPFRKGWGERELFCVTPSFFLAREPCLVSRAQSQPPMVYPELRAAAAPNQTPISSHLRLSVTWVKDTSYFSVVVLDNSDRARV